MRINGFLGVSLIDYPGKVCSIIYTSPCNFRCPYCHNKELVGAGEEVVEEEKALADIGERKDFIDAVSITGGEPTLHKGLLDFMAEVKNMGMLVKLDTNGSNPGMIKKALEHGLLDYIAMDIKAGKDNYNRAAGVKVNFESIEAAIEIIMNSGKDYEFRTTVVPGIIDRRELEDIGEIINGAACFTIQQFENRETLDSAYNNVEPYAESELEKFRDIMSGYAKKVKIANTPAVV